MPVSALNTPGVYIEEIPGGTRTIEGISTSIAAFLGCTKQGPAGTERFISKWNDYVDQFGGIQDAGDAMGFSVYSFFQNGGASAYISRVIDKKTATEAQCFVENPGDVKKIIAFSAINPGAWGNRVQIQCRMGTGAAPFTLLIGCEENGKFAEKEKYGPVSLREGDENYLEDVVNKRSKLVRAQLLDITSCCKGTSKSAVFPDGADFTSLVNTKLIVAVNGTPKDIFFEAKDISGDTANMLQTIAGVIQKQLRNNAEEAAMKNFTCTVEEGRFVLTSGSRSPESAVVVSTDAESDAAAILLLGKANGGVELTGQEFLDALMTKIDPSEPTLIALLQGGGDGNAPSQEDYQAALARLEKVRDVSILCLPGQSWSETGNPVLSCAIAHAETMQNRMLLIDLPQDAQLDDTAAVESLSLPTSTYTVAYYPWLKVASPLKSAETVLVAPSGFAAGMWSKTDARRGVWKAPAGVETALLGVAGLQDEVDDARQDFLNPAGINCIRKMPGFGPVIWGGRTLATRANPEWRYLPVRRTAIMVEQSIRNAVQWAVFEPNDHCLWASLRVNIDAFMNGLWRAGAFQGEKSSDAYFVRCNLGDTMTQDDIDRGQVIVAVGFAPLKPAEFVVVYIQQKVALQ